MHRARIPDCARMKTGFKNWFFSKEVVVDKVRGCLMGAIISVTLGEICAYRFLRQDVIAGHLPSYMTDLFIVLLAVLETTVAPFIGWVGQNRRRIMMAVACLVTALFTFLWFALPKVHMSSEGVEFCDGAIKSPDISSGPNIPLRLLIIILTFIFFGVTRLIVFSHGIAYIDEHAPSKMALHFGILTTFRMLAFVVGHTMLTESVETNMTVQILIIAIGLSINSLQVISNMPREIPKTEDMPPIPRDDRRFFSSVGRIFSNTLVTSQMVAMALTASAIWGFAYHQEAFIEAKYNLHLERNIAVNYAEILRLHVVVFVIVFLGVIFGPPVMQTIKKKDLLSITIKAYVLMILAYVVVGMLPCTTGDVAGLQEKIYMQPQCSQTCGCDIERLEILPVCVADQMITYMSPCHAGCSGVETIGGIQVYKNCTCAPLTGRATRGSCSDYSCRGIFGLHELLYTVMLSISALAIQAHGMVMLRSVDSRDKSVLVGMISSAIALFAFCCGHLLFLEVSDRTCNWYENGRCRLQNKMFPFLIGVVCAAIILFSLLITITTVVFMKKAAKRAMSELPVEQEVGLANNNGM
ncbi:unnamed protein product [Parnassius apollo]|uniref:(apollo) hypothetical protein n=1 Tax=Parnassius apollo TaxID=110799 RepID=A0A8S3Y6L5_PARAO|nr:unnamed protein product [Parnassius apollo]